MLRIVPLGGISQVTNNMFVYEYVTHHKTERLIVDCGVGFPEEEMLGADLLVPDISYLKGKEDTIVGFLLAHGHDDHIAGLPYVLPQLEGNFPIYASQLTAGFARNTLDDFGLKKIEIHEFPNAPLHLGSFTIDPVNVTHSVPDSKHFAITTPDGIVYHGSDFKFDWTPVDGKRPDVQKIAEYGKRGVLAAMVDCLRVENEGYSLSESKVGEGLGREMHEVEGKVIVTIMSSNIHRVQQVVDAAIEHHRKVAFIGRSVEENVKTAEMLGFLTIPEKSVIHKRKIKSYKDNQLCLVVAGSQAQLGSTLSRIAKGEHKIVQVKPGDHVVFSADPIPGRERSVYRLIDELSENGATVSYREVQEVLHVSGHASADELRLLLTLLKPKFIVPIGGTYRHMNQFRVLTRSMGWAPQDTLLLKDGEIAAFESHRTFVDDRIKLKTIIVDGLGIGDVGPLVLSDRRKMSQSGMVVIAVPVDEVSNQVKGRPEIATRGFVFTRQSQELIEKIKNEAAGMMPEGMMLTNWQEKREEITEELERFIFIETQREPLILITLVKS